jgi:hypothetical protein
MYLNPHNSALYGRSDPFSDLNFPFTVEAQSHLNAISYRTTARAGHRGGKRRSIPFLRMRVNPVVHRASRSLRPETEIKRAVGIDFESPDEP